MTYWLTVLALPKPEAGTTTPMDSATPRKPGHRQLAPDDHDGDPGVHHVDLHERDQRRRDEELVGDGVEQGAEPRDLVPAARHAAVEPVGEGGGDEDDGGDQDVDAVGGDQEDDDERDQHDPDQRQRDGHVHRTRSCAGSALGTRGPGTMTPPSNTGTRRDVSRRKQTSRSAARPCRASLRPHSDSTASRSSRGA